MADTLHGGENTVVVADKRLLESGLRDVSDRVRLYQQYFAPQTARVEKPAEFIQQVNGYGVQVFAQASSFQSR